jgi:hypothetical protein
MSGVFNIAKGKVGTYVSNVDAGSPANSRIIVIPFDATGATEATILDADTVAAVEAVTNVTERTTGGWGRKTLTGSDVTATVNDTDNRFDADASDQTWTGVSAGAVTHLLFCYDADSTGGADSDLIPLTWHDFPITPDGSDVVATITDFFRAS